MTLLKLGVGEANPELWDVAYFNDVRCPGRVRITGLDRKYKWDDKKAKGTSGAERAYNGADPIKFNVEIELLTEDEHEEFKTDVLPILDQQPVGEKEKPKSVSIGHATTDTRKVSAFTCDNFKGPDKGDDGRVLYSFAATEYRAPSSKNATGGISAGGTTDCGKLNNYLNKLYADQIAYFNELTMLQNAITFGQIGTPIPAEISQRMTALEAIRIGIAGQIVATISQMNALGCPGKPPSNSSLKGP